LAKWSRRLRAASYVDPQDSGLDGRYRESLDCLRIERSGIPLSGAGGATDEERVVTSVGMVAASLGGN
jgi:hypothetical protein